MCERDWVSVCGGGGGTETCVVCSCWWVRVMLLGSDGNAEETSFEDFLLECAQHHSVTGNLAHGWKSCVSAAILIDPLSYGRDLLPGSPFVGVT